MLRAVRIVVLLFILATVAQGAWLARTRTTDWQNTVRVAIYPINGDGSDATARHVGALRRSVFEPIEVFFKEQGRNYRVPLHEPVEVILAPAVGSAPPAVPFGAGALQTMWWSLRLRYWAYWNDTLKGPKPHVRMFVSYYDPARHSRLAHSTGLQKGLIGVVNAFGAADMDGSNAVVITHELLHTFGATDKYDLANNRPLFPDGYAAPGADPRYPQSQAEIMAGRIPVSETQTEIPSGMDEVVIGARTAREINWIK